MFTLEKKSLLLLERSDPHSYPHNDGDDYSPRKGSFYSDLERIYFCSSFRRLQDKAQVYPLEPEDYARTRLTHSLEVASLASSIGTTVLKNLSRDKIITRDTVLNISQDMSQCLQAAALIHDIGNPPFGHFGEDVIKNYFKNIFSPSSDSFPSKSALVIAKGLINEQHKNDFLYFDGNAQGFRIVTHLQTFNSKRYGLDLNYSVLGAMIKYPHDSTHADDKHAKFGYFFSERKTIAMMANKNSDKKWIVYKENSINPLALIMEAADDIACAVSDLEDAVQKGHINSETWLYTRVSKRGEVLTEEETKFVNEVWDQYVENLEKNKLQEPFRDTMRRFIATLRENFEKNVVKSFVDNFNSIMDGTNKESLIKLSDSKTMYRFIKTLKETYIFSHYSVVSAELQGKEIIEFLLSRMIDSVLSDDFDKFIADRSVARSHHAKILQLFSVNYVDIYVNSIAEEKANIDKLIIDAQNAGIPRKNLIENIELYYKLRLVIDQICSMTDSYAKSVYQELNGF